MCIRDRLYTGGGKPTFNFMDLFMGLIPNILVLLIRKLGIFKGTNIKFGQMGVPLRLS